MADDGHAMDSDSRNVIVAADVFMIEIFMSVVSWIKYIY